MQAQQQSRLWHRHLARSLQQPSGSGSDFQRTSVQGASPGEPLCGARIAPRLVARQEVAAALVQLGFAQSQAHMPLLDASLSSIVQVRACWSCVAIALYFVKVCACVHVYVTSQAVLSETGCLALWLQMPLIAVPLQTLALGVDAGEVLDACELLRQLSRLQERLACAILAEGALWLLVCLLMQYDTLLKQRRQPLELNAAGLPASTSTRGRLAFDLLRPSNLSGTAHTSRVTGTEAAFQAAQRSAEADAASHAAASLPVATSVAHAAMLTLDALVQHSCATQESFLLLGGTSVSLSLLAEFQVCRLHLQLLVTLDVHQR